MADSQQSGNGELHSPEVVEVPLPAALVAANPEPKRGRVGRWWKRVVAGGPQGTSGLVFSGLERLQTLEDHQQALAETVEKQLREGEERTLQHLEARLEVLESERSERFARELAKGLADQQSYITALGALAAAATVLGAAALVLSLGWISL